MHRLPAPTSLVLACLLLAGCSPRANSTLELSGRVADDTIAISAAALPVPVPQIGAQTAPSSRSRASTAVALAGLGQAVRVVSVDVETGDSVAAGQVIARLDDTVLVADVDAAKAAEKVARAQVRVLDTRLDEVADARSTIASTRSTVRSAISKLTATRADLAAKLAAAKAQRAQLQALLGRLGSLPPGTTPPSGTVPPGVPTDPTQIRALIARLDAAIAKLSAALGKIDAGLAKAHSGLGKLASASAKTTDARATLKSVRKIARAAVDARAVAADLARARLDLAVLRSPVDAVVVSVVAAGESLAPGAPVVTLRPAAAAAVGVWAAPEVAARMRAGFSASVSIDGRDTALPARVTRIGVRAVYPPSWAPTEEIHMTRAVPVRVTLQDPAVRLPAGVPADVTIDMTP